MNIAIGGDHAGFPMKGAVIELVRDAGHNVTDFGAHSEEPVDFPDVARDVCSAVKSGNADRAIMVCGTGVGAAIACNKIPGIRAALCHDVYSAHQCVEHDNVNVLCLGAQVVGIMLVQDILSAFLNAEFSVAKSSGDAFASYQKSNWMPRASFCPVMTPKAVCICIIVPMQ